VELARTSRAPDGAVISYRIARAGTPRRLLLLLHGHASNLTRWSEFVRTTTLGDAWDLVRVDLRGFGDSVWRGRLDTAVWSDDLARVLAGEGYERAVLVGHCLGANIALAFAHRRPRATAGLVLVEPMLPEALTGTLRWARRLRPLFAAGASAALALNAVGLQRRRLLSLDLETLDRETRAAVAAAGGPRALKRHASPLLDLRTTGVAAYLQGLLAVSGPLPDLAAIDAPALALLSTGGLFGDADVTERRLARLPRCRVERIDALHWIPTERPEAMRRAIDAWCARLPA
jgi:pimeloyl-ACP methyl ester carboxylesterase